MGKKNLLPFLVPTNDVDMEFAQTAIHFLSYFTFTTPKIIVPKIPLCQISLNLIGSFLAVKGLTRYDIYRLTEFPAKSNQQS